MFAYCGNNPISRTDQTGYLWSEFWQNVKKWLESKKEEAQLNEDGTETITVEIHGEAGTTKVYGFNIFDALIGIASFFMGE